MTRFALALFAWLLSAQFALAQENQCPTPALGGSSPIASGATCASQAFVTNHYPGGATAGHVATFTDSSGQVLQDGGPAGTATSIDAGGATAITNGVNGDCLGETAAKVDNFDCARLSVADQTVSGGSNVTSLSLSTGNITIDCGARPLQFITNGGAFTITAPTHDGSCMLLVTNNASAAAITFSGFMIGTSTGDPLTTTNTSKFIITVVRINSVATYLIKALQ